MKNTTTPKLAPKHIKRNKMASSFTKVIPSYAYNPTSKPPSRRDNKRLHGPAKKAEARARLYQ